MDRSFGRSLLIEVMFHAITGEAEHRFAQTIVISSGKRH
jgi:hypothetical protein